MSSWSSSVVKERAAPVSAAAVLAILVSFAAPRALACTIVAVGKDASSSGHPLVSHTDDSGADTSDVRFVYVPHKKWPSGSRRPLYNWLDGYPRVVDAAIAPDYAPVDGQKPSEPTYFIPQVPETYAYWDLGYGVQNEMGVSIGESTCTARTVGWLAEPSNPHGYNRVGIEDLSKIALERCATARCSVETMGELAVELGFYSADAGTPEKPVYIGSAEALVIADTEELWIFNVMTGANNASAIWAAQRVPPSHVAAVANTFTIRKMNLSDPSNFLYSPGVTKLAEQQGWWRPNRNEPELFDFFAAYGYSPEQEEGQDAATREWMSNLISFYSGRRMWRIFSKLSPALGSGLDPNRGNLPTTKDPYPGTFAAPEGSVSPQDVMDLLKDHYEGTPYDLTVGWAAGPFGSPNRGAASPKGVLGLWERAISMHRTSWSFVLESKPLGKSVTWLGYDAPHGTSYLPFFIAAGPAPESFHTHEGCMSKFSPNVAWWSFNLVNQYSDLNFGLINKDVREHSARIENEGRRVVQNCSSMLQNGFDESARASLRKCGNDFAERSVASQWELAWSLFAKYGRYAITHNESANGEQLQQLPMWWVANPDVGFVTWAAEGRLPVDAQRTQASAIISSLGPRAATAAEMIGSYGAVALCAGALGFLLARRIPVERQDSGDVFVRLA